MWLTTLLLLNGSNTATITPLYCRTNFKLSVGGPFDFWDTRCGKCDLCNIYIICHARFTMPSQAGPGSGSLSHHVTFQTSKQHPLSTLSLQGHLVPKSRQLCSRCRSFWSFWSLSSASSLRLRFILGGSLVLLLSQSLQATHDFALLRWHGGMETSARSTHSGARDHQIGAVQQQILRRLGFFSLIPQLPQGTWVKCPNIWGQLR